jgi:hypothetical protein
MSAAEGQEPPQVPHWMHISSRGSPGVAAIIRSIKVGGRAVVFTDSVSVVKGHLLLYQVSLLLKPEIKLLSIDEE